MRCTEVIKWAGCKLTYGGGCRASLDWLFWRYSSSDCSSGTILLAQGEFANWFKSSSLESPSRTVFFRLFLLIGNGLSLLRSMFWPNIYCRGECNLIVGYRDRTPGHVLLANFNVEFGRVSMNLKRPQRWVVQCVQLFLSRIAISIRLVFCIAVAFFLAIVAEFVRI